MKKTTRLFTMILAIMILATSIPTTKAEAATTIQLNTTWLEFHTDLEEIKSQQLTLNGADPSQVTWKVVDGYKYNKKGKQVSKKVSKIVKVNKNGKVTMKGFGRATVVATYKGKDYKCSVYVADYDKQPIAHNAHVVTDMSKKADKLFIEAVRDIINTYNNPTDRVKAAYLECIVFKNIYDYEDALDNNHDYDLSPLVTGWSYCDQTATFMCYFASYFGIGSGSSVFDGDHAINYVVLDGHKYYMDADSGAVDFMITEEEKNHLHDDAPYLYNEGENGNGRAYLYGIIIKDGAHLKELFKEMKNNNVTTFKFRDWYDYKHRDTSMAKALRQDLMTICGLTSVVAGDNSNAAVTLNINNKYAALNWENISYEITVHNWDALNLD